jgi:hypothetical protein
MRVIHDNLRRIYDLAATVRPAVREVPILGGAKREILAKASDTAKTFLRNAQTAAHR